MSYPICIRVERLSPGNSFGVEVPAHVPGAKATYVLVAETKKGKITMELGTPILPGTETHEAVKKLLDNLCGFLYTEKHDGSVDVPLHKL